MSVLKDNEEKIHICLREEDYLDVIEKLCGSDMSKEIEGLFKEKEAFSEIYKKDLLDAEGELEDIRSELNSEIDELKESIEDFFLDLKENLSEESFGKVLEIINSSTGERLFGFDFDLVQLKEKLNG